MTDEITIEWSNTNKRDYRLDEKHIIKHLKIMFPHIYTSLIWLRSRPLEYEHTVRILIPSEGDSDCYWIEFWWDGDRVQICLETIGESMIGKVHVFGFDTVPLSEFELFRDALLGFHVGFDKDGTVDWR